MNDTVRLAADAWKIMVERLPAAKVQEADGIASCIGNVPLFFLNASIFLRPAATLDDLRTLLDTEARLASSCNHPRGVIIREDWVPQGWEDLMKQAGFTPVQPMTDMEAFELLPPLRPPADLDIRRVANDGMARDLATINAEAYDVPKELFECICNMHLWQPDSYGFVGYVDGKPVSCAAAFPVNGTVYLALVATLPEAQGKGYAATVVQHTIAQGQQAMGTLHTTLHATDKGFPIYLAMGYKPGPRIIFMGPAH
jgi:GNAT superfamily N-acetyltransferase